LRQRITQADTHRDTDTVRGCVRTCIQPYTRPTKSSTGRSGVISFNLRPSGTADRDRRVDQTDTHGQQTTDPRAAMPSLCAHRRLLRKDPRHYHRSGRCEGNKHLQRLVSARQPVCAPLRTADRSASSRNWRSRARSCSADSERGDEKMDNRQTDRQTDVRRQTDRHTHTQTYRQTDADTATYNGVQLRHIVRHGDDTHAEQVEGGRQSVACAQHVG
jgi:hypothetical protein